DWDTTGPHTLADHKGRLLVVADPSGVESPGLVADLGAYLPPAQAREFLAQYETRQWIEVTDAPAPGQWQDAVTAPESGIAEATPARVPRQWHDAVTAAESGIARGRAAVPVSGMRHRAGTWEGREVADKFDTAFTAILVCGPTCPQCYLLRLPRLDEPLR